MSGPAPGAGQDGDAAADVVIIGSGYATFERVAFLQQW